MEHWVIFPILSRRWILKILIALSRNSWSEKRFNTIVILISGLSKIKADCDSQGDVGDSTHAKENKKYLKVIDQTFLFFMFLDDQ
jgi:hypothetical protein